MDCTAPQACLCKAVRVRLLSCWYKEGSLQTQQDELHVDGRKLRDIVVWTVTGPSWSERILDLVPPGAHLRSAMLWTVFAVGGHVSALQYQI